MLHLVVLPLLLLLGVNQVKQVLISKHCCVVITLIPISLIASQGVMSLLVGLQEGLAEMKNEGSLKDAGVLGSIVVRCFYPVSRIGGITLLDVQLVHLALCTAYFFSVLCRQFVDAIRILKFAFNQVVRIGTDKATVWETSEW